MRLTPTEYQLLAELIRQAGTVIPHQVLLGSVSGARHMSMTCSTSKSSSGGCDASSTIPLSTPGTCRRSGASGIASGHSASDKIVHYQNY